jgi:nitrite reductase (NO-forming)
MKIILAQKEKRYLLILIVVALAIIIVVLGSISIMEEIPTTTRDSSLTQDDNAANGDGISQGQITSTNMDIDPIASLHAELGHSHSGLPFSLFAHFQVIPQALMDSLVKKAYATGTLKHFTLIASEGLTTLPTKDTMVIFTFNGTYPAPTIRVTQGDVVQVTVRNPSSSGFVHSVDFHGSQLSAVPNFGAIPPGGSTTLTFIAINAGVWAYHCEANDVFGLWEHPLKGMAGMMIVDPASGYSSFTANKITSFTNQTINGLVVTTGNTEATPTVISPLAREFQLVYGEWYLTSSPPIHDFDKQKMFNEIPTYAHQNGIPFGYAGPLFTLPPWTVKHLSDVMMLQNLLPDNPDPNLSALVTPDSLGHTNTTALNVIAGDHVRFFIQNTGDKEVAWHIVGEQLDRVSVGNNILAKAVQTWNIPPYGDSTIDVVFSQPGIYAAVNHDYSLFFKGQVAIIVVWPSGTKIFNPSNAVPPISGLPNTSILQARCLYGIGPDKVQSKDDNTFTSKCGPL